MAYLGPLAFLGEQVSVMVGFFPFLFKGMGPHELPVAQVVYLAPLLLGRDAGQVLLPGLKKDAKQAGFKQVSRHENQGEKCFVTT